MNATKALRAKYGSKFEFLLVYVVGVPLAGFMALWCNRGHLHDADSPRGHMLQVQLGGLYRHFGEMPTFTLHSVGACLERHKAGFGSTNPKAYRSDVGSDAP